MGNSYNLPEWLSELLPEPRATHLITFKDDSYVVEWSDDRDPSLFESLEESYNAIGDPSLVAFDFKNIPEESFYDLGYFLNIEGSSNLRMLAAHTDAEKIESLEKSYEHWVNVKSKRYHENPNDFLNSYSFVNSHPAFWFKFNYNTESYSNNYYWNNADGVHSIRLFPRLNDSNEVEFAAEAGERRLPEAVVFYHDIDLDCTAGTYEELIIKMAALVSERFNIDGTKKTKS